MIYKLPKVRISIILKILYVVFLIVAFFYVRSVLNTDSFKAKEKVVAKPAVKVYEVSVGLIYQGSEETKTYQAKLKNIDTVEDLLREIRDKQGLYYEKVLYTYGTEIESVFGSLPENGKKWTVLLDDVDITTKIADENLIDNGVYTLTLL